MRMSQRFAAVLLTGALSLTLALSASAQGQGRARGQGRGPTVLSQLWIDKLGLSADQQSKVKAATEAYRADAAKARGLSGQERRQASQQARSTYDAAINTALNADQQKQLTSMREEARLYRDLGPMGTQLVALNLTDDQKSKIKEVLAKHQPDIEKLRDSAQGTSDPTAARTQRRELSQKMQEEVKAILTPEQQKQLDTALPQRSAGA